jgi:hypothetical protein
MPVESDGPNESAGLAPSPTAVGPIHWHCHGRTGRGLSRWTEDQGRPLGAATVQVAERVELGVELTRQDSE